MKILDYKNLSINGTPIAYESYVKFTKGSKTRKLNPQVNGAGVVTTDISTNFSTLKVSVRNTAENIAFFDQVFANGTNNTIVFGDDNISNVFIEVLPEREDQGITEYTLIGNPAI